MLKIIVKLTLMIEFSFLLLVFKWSFVEGFRNRNDYEIPLEVDQSNNIPMEQSDYDKLAKIYGRNVVNRHRNDFLRVGQLGSEQEQDEPILHQSHLHRIQQQVGSPHDFRSTQLNEEGASTLTPATVRRLLRELLSRYETVESELDQNLRAGKIGSELEHENLNEEEDVHIPSTFPSRCSLHGVWISAISGVAFQLFPVRPQKQPYPCKHEEHSPGILRVQVIDGTGRKTSFNSGPGLREAKITPQWSGTAQVSTESPTTISIMLQERLMEGVEPKTAVFVGQCVVCNDSPTIQGTWVIFPNNQICFQQPKPPQSDIMYLLAT